MKTSSTSAETTFSSRFAGDHFEQWSFEVVKRQWKLTHSPPSFCPASFKPIPKLPWIPSFTWPSTSRLRSEPRWCVSCPLWRRQPLPDDLFCLLLAQTQLGARPQPGEPRLSQLCSSLGPGWKTKAGGANAMAPGSCQVTDEPLAVILCRILAD